MSRFFSSIRRLLSQPKTGGPSQIHRRVASGQPVYSVKPMKRVHYAWIVAAVTFVALMGAAGFRATPGVLIVPLEHEFGWNRAIISFAVFINLILFGLTGPFAAALMNRFGIRTVTVGALVTVASGALLTTVMTAPWQLYLLWGVVVGLGTGCMASVLAATVASRWFVQRRGLVLGALTAAGATGQLIFLPFLGWLAQNRGWRSAAITVGIAALVVVPIVALFLRNRPADLGLRAYGATAADTGPLSVGNPIRNAFRGLGLGVRSRDFWLLAGSFFICGASTNGLIGTHLIPASMDHGMAEVTAASLLALIGVFAGSRPGWGFELCARAARRDLDCPFPPRRPPTPEIGPATRSRRHGNHPRSRPARRVGPCRAFRVRPGS